MQEGEAVCGHFSKVLIPASFFLFYLRIFLFPDTYLIHFPFLGGETPKETVTGCCWLQRRDLSRRDPRTGRRPPGGSRCSAHSWGHTDVFLITMLVGNRHVAEHSGTHSECQLHPALPRSQTLAGCSSLSLEQAFPSHKIRSLKKKKNKQKEKHFQIKA